MREVLTTDGGSATSTAPSTRPLDFSIARSSTEPRSCHTVERDQININI